MINRFLKPVLFLTLFAFLITGCGPKEAPIKAVNARDYYEEGIDALSANKYDKALELFNMAIKVGDQVEEEYYVSMSYYEIAFTYHLKKNDKKCLEVIEKLLSQIISSKEPRVLASNLQDKILAGKGQQNSTF